MNEDLILDALGYFEDSVIDEHFTEKEEYGAKSAKRRMPLWIKFCAAALGTYLAALIIIPNIFNLIGYSSADPYYESTHTSLYTYGELTDIIGEGTLLSNLSADTVIKEIVVTHAEDNVNEYMSVNFVSEVEGGSFSVKVHFPPYEDPENQNCGGTDSKVINGVTVEYEKNTPVEGEDYYYRAGFEYGGNIYFVTSRGCGDEAVFWEKLSELLGE